MHRYSKRLEKEISSALKEEVRPINKISINHIQEKVEQNKLEVKYKTSIEINDNIRIEYPEEYPFKQPKAFINNEPYSITLRSHSPLLKKYLKKVGHDCLCCATIFCGEWRVTYTINHFLSELKNFNRIKREVKYHMMLDEILKKYPRIPIEEIIPFLI
jgi:hypothetical protein